MDDSGVLNLADESGIAIHYWHVMDTGKDSVDLLRKLLDRFGTSLKYVLVRNQVRGADFTALEQSGEQARALGLGAKIVSVKKLHDSAINKIDASSSSFWNAKTADGYNAALGRLLRLQDGVEHLGAQLPVDQHRQERDALDPGPGQPGAGDVG